MEELVLRKLEPEPEQPAKPQNMLNQDYKFNVGVAEEFSKQHETRWQNIQIKAGTYMLDDKTERRFTTAMETFTSDEDPTDFEHILRAMRNSVVYLQQLRRTILTIF